MMQLDTLTPPDTLPDVAPAPIASVLLFEQPWLLMAVVAVASLGFAFVALTRMNRRAGPIVALVLATDALIIPAVLWYVADSTVTDREALNERAREAVDAIANWDTARVEPMLSDRVQTVFFQAPNGWDKETLLGWMEGRSGPYGVQRYDIKAVRSEIGPGGGGRTRIEVRVTPERTERPTLFICMFDWVQQADDPSASSAAAQRGYRIDTIRPLWIQGFGDLQNRR